MMTQQRKIGTNKGRGKRVRDGDKWKGTHGKKAVGIMRRNNGRNKYSKN